MTEKELIAGCLREDKHCQQVVFSRYAGKMMSVCLRYARHRMEAEDILQDGFVKVFKHLSSFQFNGSFEGWIRRIMVNTALKVCSKSAFKKENIGMEDYQDDPVNPSIFSKLSADEIMAMVSSLPEGYRIVFSLYVVEGYSHKEIGEKLEIGESTSRSQLVKARRILQKMVLEHQKIAV